MKKFDLNIERILEGWEISHAIRELIANAIDEQLLTRTKEIDVYKDKEGSWHIRDFGRGIRYEHLTQNENQEKLAHSDLVIGKFGVGLKDALATFDRKKMAVLIKSKHGDIKVERSTKFGFDDIITLHAVIDSPSDASLVGTEFILREISDEDIEAAKGFFLKFSQDKFLEKTIYGEVLKKDDSIARIYINGLKVAEEENFLFSYNITSLTQSMRKALNRERTHVGRAAYTERVKSILLSCKSSSVAQSLVQDLQEFQSGRNHDEIKWLDVASHACRILNDSNKIVFMTPNELVSAKEMVDRARNDGYDIVTIPDNVRDKISGLKDIGGNMVRDLSQYTEEWNKSFEFRFVDVRDLTLEEVKVLDTTRMILDLIGGCPTHVKEILISETMRPERHGFGEAAGLWESHNSRIIIKRSQLSDLGSYAGTLLHEIGHARSGANDVSTEFEHELTELLGIIARRSITSN
jgi:hypothetical protein